MKPIGPLMKEHRLIERMLGLINTELANVSGTGEIDTDFLDVVIDFFKIYTDKCHHGKEENIFFRGLKTKALTSVHSSIIDGLIEEHIFGREVLQRLVAARKRYVGGGASRDEIKNITDSLRTLTLFYPRHIEKEDKHFFFPSLQYLSAQEQDSMLEEFRNFDGQLIHEIYGVVVAEREKKLPVKNRPGSFQP